ncbi:hypothetical protein J6590_023507 [Homalodisca vitripennis]|nr:hypothetical protein J6590_023507 [Homalodisca vitripennis]
MSAELKGVHAVDNCAPNYYFVIFFISAFNVSNVRDHALNYTGYIITSLTSAFLAAQFRCATLPRWRERTAELPGHLSPAVGYLVFSKLLFRVRTSNSVEVPCTPLPDLCRSSRCSTFVISPFVSRDRSHYVHHPHCTTHVAPPYM